MAGKNVHCKSTNQQMTDSWIIIDDQDESDYVLIDTTEHDNKQQILSPQIKRPLNSKQNNNKKRKWKVLYSLPSTTIQGNVNSANLDSYVMDQHAQLYDKRDLFNSQQSIIKVK